MLELVKQTQEAEVKVRLFEWTTSSLSLFLSPSSLKQKRREWKSDRGKS